MLERDRTGCYVGMLQYWLLCWNVTGLVVMLECDRAGCYVGMWQDWLLCWNVTGLVVMLECDRTGCYVGMWQDWLLCWNVTGLVVMLECDRTGCWKDRLGCGNWNVKITTDQWVRSWHIALKAYCWARLGNVKCFKIDSSSSSPMTSQPNADFRPLNGLLPVISVS